MEPRLINVNDLDRYTVVIEGHRYVPWVCLAEVPTAQKIPNKLDRNVLGGCKICKNLICATCEFATCEYDEHPCDLCKGGSLYKKVSYCPNCGRPLTEEAWAELERKIGGSDGAADYAI